MIIEDITVAVATTQVDIDLTSTPIEKGELYELECTIVNGTASANDIRIDFNNSATPTNYYQQQLKANSTTVSGVRSNDNQIAEVLASNRTYIKAFLKLTNSGEFVWLASCNKNYGGSTIELDYFNGSSTTTATTITDIDIISTVANGIGVNSRIQLRKVATKVDEVIVGTATTQIDFTVDIQKGNEYLLVSDVVGNGAFDIGLGVNSDVTIANYYRQSILANSTSVTSGKNNQNLISGGTSGNKSLSITKIKLANSGIYNLQSDIVRHYGGNDVNILKFYTSKIATISSITELNVFAYASNTIGIGSRFELYKLV